MSWSEDKLCVSTACSVICSWLHNDAAIQEALSFLLTMLLVTTDEHMTVFLFCQLPRDPSSTNPEEPTAVGHCRILYTWTTSHFCTSSSLGSLLPWMTRALVSSGFSSLADIEGRPESSAPVTLVRPFRNISVHSDTHFRG